MNAHSPITRDELNLMLQEPFALNCRIPGVVQEEIGKRWKSCIPRELRKSSAAIATREKCIASTAKGTAAIGAKSRAMIAERSRVILPLHHAGKSVLQIAEIVGNGPNFVRKVIRENGFEPNRTGPYVRTLKDYSKLLKRAHSLRMDGLSWQDIGQQMGVSKTNLRKAHNEWAAAQPASGKDQPRLTKDAR